MTVQETWGRAVCYLLARMDTSDRCENSIQTLMRWIGGLLGALGIATVIALVLYGAVWLVVNMVAAVVVMAAGVIESIRPLDDKRRSRPPVSRFTLFLCFYLMAVPISLLIFMVDDVPFIYTQQAWSLILAVSLWMPMRWVCDRLMRHTGRMGRLVTASLLAVVFTPVVSNLIGVTGFHGALLDALHALS